MEKEGKYAGGGIVYTADNCTYNTQKVIVSRRGALARGATLGTGGDVSTGALEQAVTGGTSARTCTGKIMYQMSHK